MLKTDLSKITKLLLVLGTLIVFSVLSAGIANAVSVGPTDFRFTLSPGESDEETVNIGNNENVTKIAKVEIRDFVYNAETKTTTYPEEGSPYGVTSWISYSTDHQQVDPGEIFNFTFKVTVPNDADPGLYQAALIGKTEDPEVFAKTAGAPKVGMGAGAIAKIYVIVSGDFDQSINLEKFEIDQAELKQGNLVIITELKNTGTVFLSPTGEITLTDASGTLVPDIYTIKQTFEGQEVVTGREDAIPFNPLQKELVPGQSFTFSSKSEDIKLEQGKYKAKLIGYFGAETEKFEYESDFFNINEIKYIPSNIELGAAKGTSFSGPIMFDLKVKPGEDINNITSANVEIKNMFGGTKAILKVNTQQLKDTLNSEVSWDNPFGLGYYTADLTVVVGDEVQKSTTSFFYLTWWLAILIVLVLLILVFGISKYISSYNKLKEKLEKKDPTEKNE